MNWCKWAYRFWLRSQRRAAARFTDALQNPEAAQLALLRETLRANHDTIYGRRYSFADIRNFDDYQQRVPLVTADQLTDELDRIRRGEAGVLTAERVTHLIPTSGTTSAAKLIPYTAGLQRQFNAGIGPWLVDLLTQHPDLAHGPAYWSISPTTAVAPTDDTRVPVGFDDDTAYLGRIARHFANATLAAPSSLRTIQNLDDWRYATLGHLLRARGLRLISVWHPSFWTLLVDTLPQWWDQLTQDIRGDQWQLPSGATLQVNSTQPRLDLGGLDPTDPQSLWPNLKVISAWGDAAAKPPCDALQRDWPHVIVQPKGILSTEAFLSLPWRGQYPAAVSSHVIELLDDTGDALSLHQADVGGEYEAVVSTAGGLYRYRTGDRVTVTGRVAQTPTLRLLGRTQATSDICGEKLHDHHVQQAMRNIANTHGLLLSFSMLAPATITPPASYIWFVSHESHPSPPNDELLARALDQELRNNPHYNHCREIGQLSPIELIHVGPYAEQNYLARMNAKGQTLGNTKPTCLSPLADWSLYLQN
ncbi:MAG: GH3 auxin-responsive promoter family protein [Planctomycetota bacterium]